jgi:hypothetical protein
MNQRRNYSHSSQRGRQSSRSSQGSPQDHPMDQRGRSHDRHQRHQRGRQSSRLSQGSPQDHPMDQRGPSHDRHQRHQRDHQEGYDKYHVTLSGPQGERISRTHYRSRQLPVIHDDRYERDQRSRSSSSQRSIQVLRTSSPEPHSTPSERHFQQRSRQGSRSSQGSPQNHQMDQRSRSCSSQRDRSHDHSQKHLERSPHSSQGSPQDHLIDQRSHQNQRQRSRSRSSQMDRSHDHSQRRQEQRSHQDHHRRSRSRSSPRGRSHDHPQRHHEQRSRQGSHSSQGSPQGSPQDHPMDQRSSSPSSQKSVQLLDSSSPQAEPRAISYIFAQPEPQRSQSFDKHEDHQDTRSNNQINQDSNQGILREEKLVFVSPIFGINGKTLVLYLKTIALAKEGDDVLFLIFVKGKGILDRSEVLDTLLCIDLKEKFDKELEKIEKEENITCGKIVVKMVPFYHQLSNNFRGMNVKITIFGSRILAPMLQSAVNDRRYVFHFRPKPNIWPEKHLALGRIPKPKPNVQIYVEIGGILL